AAPTGAAAGAAPAAAGSTVGQQTNPYTAEWLIGSAVSDANGPQYKEVTDAITRFRNGDQAGARELLTQARKDHSKIPPIEVLMGRLAAAANNLGASRNEFEKAIIANPKDPDAYLYFAEIALAERRVADAQALLIEVKPLIDSYEESKRKHNFQIRFNSDS